MTSSEFSYAKALFRSCKNQEDYSAWIVYLAFLNELTMRSDFQRFYRETSISTEQKIIFILKLRSSITQIQKNFLRLLVNQDKLNNVSVILRAFKDYVFEASPVLDVVVKTAYYLDLPVLKKIEKFVKNRYKKDVNLIQSIEVIKGIEIYIGNDVLTYTADALIKRAVKILQAV
jgi:ATP synthase F1 delta subunit